MLCFSRDTLKRKSEIYTVTGQTAVLTKMQINLRSGPCLVHRFVELRPGLIQVQGLSAVMWPLQRHTALSQEIKTLHLKKECIEGHMVCVQLKAGTTWTICSRAPQLVPIYNRSLIYSEIHTRPWLVYNNVHEVTVELDSRLWRVFLRQVSRTILGSLVPLHEEVHEFPVSHAEMDEK